MDEVIARIKAAYEQLRLIPVVDQAVDHMAIARQELKKAYSAAQKAGETDAKQTK